MLRVLLVTASFGDGHNQAAVAIRDALQARPLAAQTIVADLQRAVENTVGSVHHGLKTGQRQQFT